jgi:dephospho-CoA kinase
VESGYMIIVVPLLVESPLKAFMDRVLVVNCSEATQLQRLLTRDQEDDAQARRIIASQASREERLRIADDVVQNDGDPDATRQSIAELHEFYLEQSRLGRD